jgi:hypothetical protein
MAPLFLPSPLFIAGMVYFLYTGGVSYKLFISLFISKLFCTKGCLGRGGRAGEAGGGLLEEVGPEKYRQYRALNPLKAHWKGWALKI